MTPKEKAIKLVDEYRLILIQSDTDAGEEILCTIIAKQCALIAVDEVLKEEFFWLQEVGAKKSESEWQQVKQEINKL